MEMAMEIKTKGNVKQNKTKRKGPFSLRYSIFNKTSTFAPQQNLFFVWKFLSLKSRNILAFYGYLKSIGTQF